MILLVLWQCSYIWKNLWARFIYFKKTYGSIFNSDFQFKKGTHDKHPIYIISDIFLDNLPIPDEFEYVLCFYANFKIDL
jgi:hypothetical protein